MDLFGATLVELCLDEEIAVDKGRLVTVGTSCNGCIHSRIEE
jgi:hypothetical protein